MLQGHVNNLTFIRWEGQFIEMTSVTEDKGMKSDCSEIQDLLHKNIDSVWEKATVSREHICTAIKRSNSD